MDDKKVLIGLAIVAGVFVTAYFAYKTASALAAHKETIEVTA